MPKPEESKIDPAKAIQAGNTPTQTADASVAPDMTKICEKWMTSTEAGREFLRSKLPQEIFFGGETLPGNPMEQVKQRTNIHHELGWFLTEAEAKEGLRNRTLAIVGVRRAE